MLKKLKGFPVCKTLRIFSIHERLIRMLDKSSLKYSDSIYKWMLIESTQSYFTTKPPSLNYQSLNSTNKEVEIL